MLHLLSQVALLAHLSEQVTMLVWAVALIHPVEHMAGAFGLLAIIAMTALGLRGIGGIQQVQEHISRQQEVRGTAFGFQDTVVRMALGLMDIGGMQEVLARPLLPVIHIPGAAVFMWAAIFEKMERT